MTCGDCQSVMRRHSYTCTVSEIVAASMHLMRCRSCLEAGGDVGSNMQEGSAEERALFARIERFKKFDPEVPKYDRVS